MNIRRLWTLLAIFLGSFALLAGLSSTSALAQQGPTSTISMVEADAPSATLPLVDDFNAGVPTGLIPFADSWDGSGTATSLALGTAMFDAPDLSTVTNTGAIAITYSVAATIPNWGGGPGYAGIARNFDAAQDWSGWTGISFWWIGDGSGGDHRIELRTTGADANASNRYEYTFTDDVTGARRIDVPFSMFTARTDYNPGPSPTDPLNQAAVWGYGFLLAPGSSGVRTIDHVALTHGTILKNFDAGDAQGTIPFADSWDGSGTATSFTGGVAQVAKPEVPVVTDTNLYSATYNIAATIPNWGGGPGYAGIAYENSAAADWSDYDGISFWFHSSGTGSTFRVELRSTSGDGGAVNTNRFEYSVVDSLAGWSYAQIPFSAFTQRTDWNPGPGVTDPIDLTQMWGYGLLLAPGANGSFKIDDIGLYGSPDIPMKASFAADSYSVTEGDTVTVSVALNMAATEPATVTVAFLGSSSATETDDYSLVGSQSAVFTVGETSKDFVINTVDDALVEGAEDINLQLGISTNLQFGNNTAATVSITDNDFPPVDGPTKLDVVDNFEDGVQNGVDENGLGLGFITWGDDWNGTTVAISATTAAAAGIMDVPGAATGNHVLEIESNVVGWGGFTHAFENDNINMWVPQDWSNYSGIGFWYYGTGTGTTVFVDVAENRNDDSTTDDAERWSYEWTDNQAGWQYVEVAFADMSRKDIGNGAPNDGWSGEEVHGWALGTTGTNGNTEKRYIDDFGLTPRVTVVDDYESGLPNGTDGDGLGLGFVTWGDDWNGTTVAISDTTAALAGIPDVPGADSGNHIMKLESNVVGWGGFTHAFENGAVDTWVPQDWSTYEGICFWYYGTGTGTIVFVDVAENRNGGSTTDDAERWSYEWTDNQAGWQFVQIPFSSMNRKDIGNGAPNDGWTGDAVHGYAVGTTGTSGNTEMRYVDNMSVYGNTGVDTTVKVAFGADELMVAEGGTLAISVTLNMSSTMPVSVTVRSAESYATAGRDYTAVNETIVFAPGETMKTVNLVTMEDDEVEGDEQVMVNLYDAVNAEYVYPQRTLVEITDNDTADANEVEDYEGTHPYATSGNITLSSMEIDSAAALALPDQDSYEYVIKGEYDTGTTGFVSFLNEFVEPQDWSARTGLNFMYYGSGNGDTVTIEVLSDKVATTADVAASDWVMIWADEFDGAAGEGFNTNNWSAEMGDGTMNGIPGWGNGELEYYRGDNAKLDGNGNLVITAEQADPAEELLCYYGPCEYTSSRLISSDLFEVEYGKIEARLQVPFGQGIWPAFWMLGNDIDSVGWPQSGEIDVMEFIGREPNTVHGTIHGPGYSGGQGIGGSYDVGAPVSDAFHVFSIEWEPNEIRWYIDGTEYFSVTPADLNGNEWVFDHPFYLLMNVAVGGNWPGMPDATSTFPQTMTVDYVRVYGAADTSTRHEYSFIDNRTGWVEMNVPYTLLNLSETQPSGATGGAFNSANVWGYGFRITDSGSSDRAAGVFYLDQVNLITGAPTSVNTAEVDGAVTHSLQLVAAVAGALMAVAVLVTRRARRLATVQENNA